MANVIPFQAYRPKNGLEKAVAALPYDVYSREEAAAAVRENPDSFLAIDRAETGFAKDVDTYAPEVYERARSLLQEWIAGGKFVKEKMPCFYLYEQAMEGRSRTGVVGCVSIDDYVNGIVKRHEKTRADKEQDRFRHVDICNMQTGPILLACPENTALRALIGRAGDERLLYDFVSEDGVSHRVWAVSDKEQIQNFQKAFDKIPALYIADGHHRCACAVRAGLKRREQSAGFTGREPYNYFLSVIFPGEELQILDYNRVVKDLNGLSCPEFLKAIKSQGFLAEKRGKTPYRPKRKGVFGMYLEGEWYKLSAGAALQSADPVKGLDVSVLQNRLLSPVLGIHHPKTDKRIDFVGGIRGLEELERRVGTDMRIAFSLYPTSMGELFAVADAGKLMPPKSTWFEPKLRSGLFLYSIDANLFSEAREGHL